MEICNLRIVKSITIDTASPDGTISGYASVFGNIDDYGDVILAGAYDDVINGPMPKMFFNHQSYSGVPIGIWTSMSVDERGLKVTGRINLELALGREVYSAIKQGAIDGLSVCIDVVESYWTDDDFRVIVKVAGMPEISICTFPANTEARLTDVKSKLGNSKTLSDYEKILREAGFSKGDATAFVSSLKKSVLLERDATNKIDDLYSLIVSVGSHK